MLRRCRTERTTGLFQDVTGPPPPVAQTGGAITAPLDMCIRSGAQGQSAILQSQGPCTQGTAATGGCEAQQDQCSWGNDFCPCTAGPGCGPARVSGLGHGLLLPPPWPGTPWPHTMRGGGGGDGEKEGGGQESPSTNDNPCLPTHPTPSRSPVQIELGGAGRTYLMAIPGSYCNGVGSAPPVGADFESSSPPFTWVCLMLQTVQFLLWPFRSTPQCRILSVISKGSDRRLP